MKTNSCQSSSVQFHNLKAWKTDELMVKATMKKKAWLWAYSGRRALSYQQPPPPTHTFTHAHTHTFVHVHTCTHTHTHTICIINVTQGTHSWGHCTQQTAWNWSYCESGGNNWEAVHTAKTDSRLQLKNARHNSHSFLAQGTQGP